MRGTAKCCAVRRLLGAARFVQVHHPLWVAFGLYSFGCVFWVLVALVLHCKVRHFTFCLLFLVEGEA